MRVLEVKEIDLIISDYNIQKLAVMITGQSDQEIVAQLFKYGANDFIVKLFRSGILKKNVA